MNENASSREGHLYLFGTRGYSAYEVAVQNGFVGTEEEWLESLVGPQGEQGIEGKSAYEVAVENGYEGTEEEWLNSFLTPYNYYSKSEIDNRVVDNLESNSSEKMLSAKQGKILNETDTSLSNRVGILENSTNVLSLSLSSETQNRQTEDTRLNNAIDTANARIDSIASLPSGSTTGDAELIDTRVDYKGFTYQSAGKSVRGQIDEINNKLEYKEIDLNSLGWELGSINTIGNPMDSTTKIRTKWVIFVKRGSIVKTKNGNKFGVYCYSRFDSKTDENARTLIDHKAVSDNEESFTIKYDCYVMLVIGNSSETTITEDDIDDMVANNLIVNLITYENPIRVDMIYDSNNKYKIPLRNNMLRNNNIVLSSNNHLSSDILVFDKNIGIKIENDKYLFKVLTFSSYTRSSTYNYSSNYTIEKCTPYVESGNVLYVPKNTQFLIGFMNKDYSAMTNEDIAYLSNNITIMLDENKSVEDEYKYTKEYNKDFELVIGGYFENGAANTNPARIRSTLFDMDQDFSIKLITNDYYYRVLYYDYNPNLTPVKQQSYNYTIGTETTICKIPPEITDRKIRLEFVRSDGADIENEELASLYDKITIKVKDAEEFLKDNKYVPIPLNNEIPETAVEYHAKWDIFVNNNLCERKLLGYVNENEDYPIYEYVIKHDKQWLKENYIVNRTDTELYNRPKILITSGMHGNEILTPNTLWEFIYKMFYDDNYYEYLNRFDFYIIPMTNPSGYNARTRLNINGKDVNRDAINLETLEAQLLTRIFNERDYDMYLDMHQTANGSAAHETMDCGFLAMDYEATEEEKSTVYKKLQEAGCIIEKIFSEHYNKQNLQTVFPWKGSNDENIFRNYARNHAKYCLVFETSKYCYYYSGSDTENNEVANLFTNTFTMYVLKALFDIYKQ